MATRIFISLPVSDVCRAKEFFGKLDFRFNRQFTDDQATCMTLGDNIFVMLLANPFFQSFTRKTICDTGNSAEVIVALSAESKSKVDELADKALAAGAIAYNEPQDQGFMYSRNFQDLDGHLWEVVYVNPTALT